MANLTFFAMLVVALVALALAEPKPVEVAVNDPQLFCSKSNCAECAGASGCGWCGSPSTGSCHYSSPTGAPLSSSCDEPSVWYRKGEQCTLQDVCNYYTSCSDCNKNDFEHCGWCAGTQTCMRGNSNGPSVGTCGAGWQWRVLDCAEPCPTSNCDTCAGTTGCGWCGSPTSGQCRISAGGVAGPFSGSCDGTNMWYRKSDQCTLADPCNSYTSCGDCNVNSYQSCGWCASTTTCSRGSSNGPATGDCPGEGAWQWSTTSCLTLCQTSTCEQCADHSGCGWCGTAASGTCRISGGALAGPAVGQCSAPSFWYRTAEQCSFADPCEAYTTCSDCNVQTGQSCGWCAGTQTCMQGTADGPGLGKTCPTTWQWREINCAEPCPTSNCEACAASSGCGWCGTPTGGECRISGGAALGPAVGSCDGTNMWYRKADQCGLADPCSWYTTCSDCNFNSYQSCGWCASSQTCMRGSSSGPVNAADCPSVAWMWRVTNCAEPCPTSTCAICAGTTGCGWCGSPTNGSCKISAGSQVGPLAGSCKTPSYWYRDSDQCDFEDPCNAYTTCSSCAVQNAQNCGWCTATSLCSTGTKDGPAKGTCASDWQFTVFGCATSVCTGTTCLECVAQSTASSAICGWCVQGNGTASCERSGTCYGSSTWYSSINSCPGGNKTTCAKFTKCTTNLVKIDNAANVTCKKAVCTQDECCRGLCSKYKSCGSKAKPRKDKVCAKKTCTKAECCVGACKISSFSYKCKTRNWKLKANQTNILCAGAVCNDTDCCAGPNCGTFNCVKYGQKAYDNATLIPCAKSTCTKTECCRSNCKKGFTCKKPLKAVASPQTVWCAGQKCLRSECCQAVCTTKFPCVTPLTLKPNVTTIRCAKDVCTPADCCQ